MLSPEKIERINVLARMKIVDQEGTDVTPDKLKQIQKEKKIHNRHLED